jgi:hypothetical protein
LKAGLIKISVETPGLQAPLARVMGHAWRQSERLWRFSPMRACQAYANHSTSGTLNERRLPSQNLQLLAFTKQKPLTR